MARLGPALQLTFERERERQIRCRREPERDDDLRRLDLSLGRVGGRSFPFPAAGAGPHPVSAQLTPELAKPGEKWNDFRQRQLERLGPAVETVGQEAGVKAEMSFTGQVLGFSANSEQVETLARARSEIDLIELDPLVDRTLISVSVSQLLRLDRFRAAGGGDGAGVTVAIVDSGVDTHHPALHVAQSATTCGEPSDLPGLHGTMTAGVVASADQRHPGLAAGVELLNIKALQANGATQSTPVTRGIDEAVVRGANVICLSAGFSHLPGPGNLRAWTCPSGKCAVCISAENALELGALLVVSAGNDHLKAAALTHAGGVFDSEICCPAASEGSLSVGAIDSTGTALVAADFSSCGPAAGGLAKPDLSAPGVTITSTRPAPRDAQGQPLASPSAAQLFDTDSGTSMAAPIVAGCAALIWEEQATHGQATARSVRLDLMKRVKSLGLAANAVGRGLVQI